jgi:tRNA threonylcarbamoyladenosine biosynthesis protein TsaE
MKVLNQNTQAITLELINDEASKRFAAQLAPYLTAPLILALSGEIGTGKTTIVRALLKSLGIKSAIKSPTFSLVETYYFDTVSVHHFDLYRIHHEDELEYMGFREYFNQHSICCIEWAEHAGRVLPQVDIHLKLSIKGAGREMQIDAHSNAGKRILAYLAGNS